MTYQGCANAGLCYVPITKTLSVSLPPGGAGSGGTAAFAPSTGVAAASASGGFMSEQDRLATLIRDGNLLLVLATFFGLGLLLAFTPCVLPMVPILSGIIAGHGANVTTTRAFMLSLTYVLGMACTYTVAGIAVAAAGSHVQALFQQTWIIVLFAGLFVVLALSMMGLFTIPDARCDPDAAERGEQSPDGRQLRRRRRHGRAVGADRHDLRRTALVATLAVIGQSGNMSRGAAALFAMSLGMGAPLLVVGASAGNCCRKPAPGWTRSSSCSAS